jgi:DHA1 family tetracycline resistance protein-like MFS transporter
MLLGTVFYAQIFGYFLSEAAPVRSPSVAFFIAGAGMVLVLVLFWRFAPKEEEETAA